MKLNFQNDKLQNTISQNTQSQKVRTPWLSVTIGDPTDILHRLDEFIKLFLSDGLLPDLVYALGLKNA